MIALLILYWVAFRLACQVIGRWSLALSSTRSSIAPDHKVTILRHNPVDAQMDYDRKLAESQSLMIAPRQIRVRLN